jgi:hypothetical protein
MAANDADVTPLSPDARSEVRRLIAEMTALLELLAQKIEQEHPGP